MTSATPIPGHKGVLTWWQGNIDTTLLADGAHTLVVTVTSATGKRVTRLVPFISDNSSQRSLKGQIVNFDSPSLNERVSGSLALSGWAVSAASPVNELDILIDGVPMGAAAYGLARTDVCKAYPNSLSYPSVGWYYLLDTRTLADGAHTVEAIGIAAGGHRCL